MPRYAAVTLDAMNTIVHTDPAPPNIYAHHISQFGPSVSSGEVADLFGPAWAAIKRHTPPGRDRYSCYPGGERAWWGAFVREILHRLHHPAPWEPLLDELWGVFSDAATWRVYPETVGTLNRLCDRGINLGLVSNWDRRLPGLLESLGIDGLFHAITVSSLEGFEKPSPEIFRRSLDELGVTPEQAIHVGDNPAEDYRGAEAVGITPVLIDRRRRYADGPYRRIEDLGQLLEFIG
jgi:putative hydrolase of the HAD superfamily